MKRFLLALFTLTSVLTAAVSGRDNPFDHLVLTREEHPEIVEKSEDDLRAALQSVSPSPRRKVAATILEGKRYVLHGDLFKTGRSYAIAEILSQEGGFDISRCAFLTWQGGRWVLKTLWDIPTTWRPKDWQPSENDYLAIKPSEKPFWLHDFDGDGVPEVVMAADVHKYFQDHYIFHFDKKERLLSAVNYAMAAPISVDGFTRLYYKSPRRSIFEEWQFCRWFRGRMVDVASWHNETPYNTGDSFVTATQQKSSAGPRSSITAIMDDANPTGIACELKMGSATATLRAQWTKPRIDSSDRDYESFERYLFRKTTGLPPQLFPEATPGSDHRPSRLESFARIRVKGDKALVQIFQ